MNWLDAVLVLACLLSALAGFRHGFVLAVSSLAGFLAGAWAGLTLVPALLADAPRVFTTSVVAVLLVLVCAALGQFLGALGGRALRRLITWRPGRMIDSSAGALTTVSYVLVLSWVAGAAVATTGVPGLGGVVRDSSVLRAVDAVLPDTGPALFGRFAQVLDRGGFPAVFAPYSPESIAPAAPPVVDESVTPAVLEAARSVVRVQGAAVSCARQVTGSGFVFADGVVVTNAHVVAGVPEPVVTDPAGDRHAAEVVLFDPEADLAVLRVPGLTAAPLPFGDDIADGGAVATIGYPGGGDQRIGPARVRTRRTITGPDIYASATVAREVYALRAQVIPGDSGGPLVSPDGVVVGVVFAASLDDPQTGYAFTAAQALPIIERGVQATQRVPVGACV